MTIRTRLAFWYGGILFTGLLLIAGWTYYEMAVEHPEVMAVFTQHGETAMEEVGEIILFGGLPAVALALVGGWFLMRRALQPVSALTHAVERVQANHLWEQLPRTANGDELDRLTEVFNSMVARLDHSFSHIREFTLHASHELKTPLAVIRSECETALGEATLSATERERTLSLLEEIERLTHIVDNLSFLTQADAEQLKLSKAPLALDGLVHEALEDARALAHPKHIEVTLGECSPASVVGDRRRLRQLLLILADNAVKFNQERGRVTLALRVENQTANLSVSNNGPGIAPGVIPRVFDPFFRGGGEADGCGLGLAIAHWIVRAHGGEIAIASDPGRLTTVTVRLPMGA